MPLSGDRKGEEHDQFNENNQGTPSLPKAGGKVDLMCLKGGLSSQTP